MQEAEESLRRHRSLATALPSGALPSRVAKSISQAERAWAMTKNRRDKTMSKQINWDRVRFVGRRTLDHRYESGVRDRDRASRWLRAVERNQRERQARSITNGSSWITASSSAV